MARLKDGHATTVTFASAPSAALSIYEKSVQPAGLDGGGEIDQSSMRNTTWMTKAPPNLKGMSNASFTAAYDPGSYDDYISMLNDNQEITVTFPDNSTLVFWGWVSEFTPQALTIGEEPQADVTIIPSNQNDSDVETAPVYAA